MPDLAFAPVLVEAASRTDLRATAVPVLESTGRPAPGFLAYKAAKGIDPALEAVRRINASIPFSGRALETATPFLIFGPPEDRKRAQDCLAAAAYYEAGTSETGQRAVIQVVLNRLRHARYPRSICAVVFEGTERPTGCQFTFTCDGALERYRPSPDEWRRAKLTAADAVRGYAEPTVGLATHYHTDWVHPRWSGSLDKVAAVDTHLFFLEKRSRPSELSARYLGIEPRIAKMAGLSVAHLPDTPPPHMLPDQPVADEVARNGDPLVAGDERLPERATAMPSGIFLVTLDATADPDSFQHAAEEQCSGRTRCRVIGWTDSTKRVDNFPLPGFAIDAISFSFNKLDSRTVEVRWNCSEFRRRDPRQCIWKTM